jgi:serine/threonine protein kinase
MSESPSESGDEFLLPGTVVGDRYRICEVLASGGMGVVYRAVHLELGSEVAVKTIRPELVADDDVYERFVREARNAAQLETSHVAKVFDFGRMQGGSPYLVMELLHGESLGARMKRGALSNEEAAKYLLEACAGLADAHGRGIIHRDLKPDNLFLSNIAEGESELKLLDFGISKSLKFTRSLTMVGGGVGSPNYMSPEQMRSRTDLDHRTDIWSLGAVAYEALAGAPAFDGESVTEICAKVLMDPPRALTVLREDVWPELDFIISRCLEREPKDRFQDVLELSHAVEAAVDAHAGTRISRSMRQSVPTSANANPGPVDCTAATEVNLNASLEVPVIAGPSRRRWPARVALVTALAAVIAAAWVWWLGLDRVHLYARHQLEARSSSKAVIPDEPVARVALSVPTTLVVQAPAAAEPLVVPPAIKPKRIRAAPQVNFEPAGVVPEVAPPVPAVGQVDSPSEN